MFCFFDYSTNRLASRLQNGEDTIAFDKDDDDTLDFVTASSNLRSVVYAIEEKTRWEIKGMYTLIYMSSLLEYTTPTEMAGNIIPAIATTNAIISGLIVLQALHLLRKSYESLTKVFAMFIYNSNHLLLLVVSGRVNLIRTVESAEIRMSFCDVILPE